MKRHTCDRFWMTCGVAVIASLWSTETGLSIPPTTPAATYLGEKMNDKVGKAMAAIGDVNNDGFDDFLIGAKDNSDGGAKAGKAYLIFGKSSGWASDVGLANADASFVGAIADDKVGEGVAGIGDVNSDGFDDFAIGAPHEDTAGFNAGKVYIFFGQALGWTTGTSISTANASFIGESVNDKVGTTIAGVGDVNGDGYSDFIIGAKDHSGAALKTGKVYLILGKNSGWAQNVSLTGADASFVGENTNDKAGDKCTGVGDVNSDGFKDFVIGAKDNNDGGLKAGKAYLILGKSTGWTNNVNLATANATFIGENATDKAAEGLSGIGDTNGDGYDDFVIAAPDNSSGGFKTGKVYLILGKPAGWAANTSLVLADASFLGENINDKVGKGAPGANGVAGVGDVNNDGFADFLIGSKDNSDNGLKAGKAYLILGKSSGWAWNVVLSNADASYLGESAADKFSDGLSAAGDLNNDGYADFIIASPDKNTTATKAGKVYVFIDSATLRIISWKEVAPK